MSAVAAVPYTFILVDINYLEAWFTTHSVKWDSLIVCSHQQLSGRVLRNAERPDKKISASRGLPMRFKGWNRPGNLRSDYKTRFSRPRARTARAELLKDAARGAAHNGGPSGQFAPSALPGILLRDSLPAGYIPTAVATGDFNGDGAEIHSSWAYPLPHRGFSRR
jgi:hypothetical protein